MTNDILEKLKRLGGAKVTTAETLGIGKTEVPAAVVAAVASATKAKVASNWAEELYGSTAEVDEVEEDESEDEDEATEDQVDEDEDDESDIPESSHREPVSFRPTEIKPEDIKGLPGTDEFARRVAELVFAKIRDAFNSMP